MQGGIVEAVLRELQLRIPNVGALRVVGITIGPTYTGVRISGCEVGVAYSSYSEWRRCSSKLSDRAGTFTDRPAIELAKLANSWDLCERVVRVVALNAVSQVVIEGSDGLEKECGDAATSVELGRDDTIVVVSSIQPTAEILKRKGTRILVLERNPELRGGVRDFRRAVSQCGLVPKPPFERRIHIAEPLDVGACWVEVRHRLSGEDRRCGKAHIQGRSGLRHIGDRRAGKRGYHHHACSLD